LSERKRNQKRRDKKGRILRNGESQRADGRYAFVYTDSFGKQKFLYSWKLEPTDSLPAGCRPCKALREKEKEILKDIGDGITPYGNNLTVLDLVKSMLDRKRAFDTIQKRIIILLSISSRKKNLEQKGLIR
jgi:hypothetical protein